MLIYLISAIEGLTPEEEVLRVETRDALFEELYYACRCQVSSMEELGVRYGKICNIIPIIKVCGFGSFQRVIFDFSESNIGALGGLLDRQFVGHLRHRHIPSQVAAK